MQPLQTKFTYVDGRGERRRATVPLASGDAMALRAEYRLARRELSIPDALYWLRRHDSPALKRLSSDEFRRVAVLCVRDQVEVHRG